jgi:hypothetical protein
MRRTSQYLVAAICGGGAGFLVAEGEKLVGLMIGAGVAMAIVLFCHIYPRVGYAEHKINGRDSAL